MAKRKKATIERDFTTKAPDTKEGANTRGKAKIARDSLEVSQLNKKVYPDLASYSDDEQGRDELTQKVGTLISEPDSDETDLDFSYENSQTWSDGSQNSDDKKDQVKKDQVIEEDVQFSRNYKSIIILIVLVFGPIMALCFRPIMRYSLEDSSKLNKMLESELSRFSPFLLPNKQNELKQNIIAKLHSQKNSDPLSIFLMSDQNQQLNVSSFASNLAHIFAKFSKGGNDNNFYVLSTTTHYEKDLDAFIDQKLETDVAALVIEDFTNLNWNQAKLFLRYCDNENAPYKDKLFIFIATVSGCDPLRPDASTEAALLNAWNAEDETIEALSARVTAISTCFL